MIDRIKKEIIIPLSMGGNRIDKVLSELWPDYSRARITKWLHDKAISVDGSFMTAKTKVAGGESVILDATVQNQECWDAQAIDLTIAYEDDDLLIVNKPAGLVVHPGAGNPDSTLVNALLHYHTPLGNLPRAGIIHRLDKDTTGLLIVAKTLKAHHHLVAMMQERQIKRRYQALVAGELIKGCIDAPIARHPKNRIKMAVVKNGKPAVTHYQCIKTYPQCSLLDVELETGRTHQIRVHMSYTKHPIIGDQLYGKQNLITNYPTAAENSDSQNALIEALTSFKRQALHAYSLTLANPISNQLIAITAPLPDDFSNLLQLMDKCYG